MSEEAGVLWLYVERELTPWKESMRGDVVARLALAAPPGYRCAIAHYLPAREALADLVSRHQVVFNLCYGYLDQSQSAIARWLDSLGVALTSPPGEAQARAADKAALPALCAELGLATPPLLDAAALERHRELVISKPRFGACHRDLLIGPPEEILAQGKAGPDRLVQPYLAGREYTVAVIPDREGRGIEALPPAEIVPTPPRHVYAAGKAYGATDLDKRPELPAALAEELKRAAVRLHAHLGLHAYSRIDFRVSGGRPHVLDINSMPNVDPSHSYLPEIAAEHGVGLTELIGRILRLSLAAGPRRAVDVRRTFQPALR